MRRAVVSTTATVAGVILLLSLKPHDTGTTASTKVISSTPESTPSASSSVSASSSSRSITGDAIDTRYGAVQVKVTLEGTRITKVDVLQYPSNDHRDQEINSYALPVLNQEAIAAQSAGIDVVSGATYTSDGYTRSLQSALDRAGSR